MKDVELTPEETIEALIRAKRDKMGRITELERQERIAANRKALTTSQWDTEQTRAFMLYRAPKLFEGQFNADGSPKKLVLDEYNKIVFDLLCLYFSNDLGFVSMATNLQVAKPSLDKGIILLGNFGVGKTLLMRLFQKNQRQVFNIKNVKHIADEYAAHGEESKEKGPFTGYVDKPKNPVNDAESFYHPFSGLCLDDLGTEDVRVHYGNRKNVIGDLIEKRYDRQNTGVFLHATSNLDLKQVTEFYGGRVLSRMYEIFNFIELPGPDRRK